MAASNLTPAYGFTSVDDGWTVDDGWSLEANNSVVDDGWALDDEPPVPETRPAPVLRLVADPVEPEPAPALEDGWGVAADDAPHLELTDAERAFFDAGEALIDQKVETFDDLDPTPAAPAKRSLWKRLLRR